MTTTSIEWTDEVWNPVRGCVKVSAGCKNCYAETFAERWRGVKGHPYEQGFDLRLVPEKLGEPLSWRKPRRVFVNSMSDLFQEGVPHEFVDRVFAVMALAQQHTFQVLTKRPSRMHAYLTTRGLHNRLELAADSLRPGQGHPSFGGKHMLPDLPLRNVWLGASAEDEDSLEERWPYLRDCPAAVRFLSLEPLLEDVNVDAAVLNRPGCMGGAPHADCEDCGRETIRPDWIIVGGESGPGARPFDADWAYSIVSACRAASVACFVKQLGSYAVLDTRYLRHLPGWSRKLRDRKGGDPAEWPADLRVRQFPKVRR